MVLRRIMRMVHQKRNRTDAPVTDHFRCATMGIQNFYGRHDRIPYPCGERCCGGVDACGQKGKSGAVKGLFHGLFYQDTVPLLHGGNGRRKAQHRQTFFRVMTDRVRGKTNNNEPVILFRTVCTAANFFCRRNAKPAVKILIAAIQPIQTHSHAGMCRKAISFARHDTKNRKSAAVSSFAPKAPAVPSFLATVPPIMSVNPAVRYKI